MIRSPDHSEVNTRLTHIHDALDWLEANPKAHIKNFIATPAPFTFLSVTPTSPTAQCWCAVGRICKEAGLNYSIEATAYLRPFAGKDEIDFRNQIQNINDFATPTTAGKREALNAIRALFPPRP